MDGVPPESQHPYRPEIDFTGFIDDGLDEEEDRFLMELEDVIEQLVNELTDLRMICRDLVKTWDGFVCSQSPSYSPSTRLERTIEEFVDRIRKNIKNRQ